MITLIPQSERRTLGEMSERLDLASGNVSAKRSAFWVMLALSGVIAVSGVIADSTATVIGAMIIAPLSTPILGIGLGIVAGRGGIIGRSLLYVVLSVGIVVALGVIIAQLLPNPTNVLSNSQVTGRTSPTLVDLMAALATGFAGAIAMTRRDVGDVLPGVAIAISLVPPLGVVGVCLGSGAEWLAFGALVLFLSNVLALVFACTVVLMLSGYARDAIDTPRSARRGRAYISIAVGFVVVIIPMVLNSLSSLWAGQVQNAAEQWLSNTDSAQVQKVTVRSEAVVVDILSPGDLPNLGDLQRDVDEIVPWSPDVVVQHNVGQRLEGSTN
ncbi:TIGR00341 family protein [Dietzia sp. ANT_WB102]|uniref:TIGR00341 family protein n=1 Tax=Dietzia sp. ANT_WB102 TaxID=2597345 RepID=UPI0011ED086D|nr:TIGR00341 family protein [Dietzia sp. ANT_WB102]KAA0918398.1 TIGR00341 family protein [Dietzia sp. ANT_WB102]